MRVLLDTDVVSELRKGRRCDQAVAAWQSGIDLHALFLSVVTLLELRLGIALKARQDETAADVLMAWYEKAVKPTLASAHNFRAWRSANSSFKRSVWERSILSSCAGSVGASLPSALSMP